MQKYESIRKNETFLYIRYNNIMEWLQWKIIYFAGKDLCLIKSTMTNNIFLVEIWVF